LSDSTQPVIIIPFGDFGLVAADALAALLPTVSILHGEAESALSIINKDNSAIAVLTSSCALPAISDGLDLRSHRCGTPFLSLTLRNDHMLLGPTIIPGRGSCWRCWIAREHQVDTSPLINQRRAEHYSKNPSVAPKGFLASLAFLGAAQLAQLLDDIQSPASAKCAGAVTHFDLFGRTIVSGRCIGLDNCNRCGMKRPPLSRSHAEMSLALEQIWASE
jgi:bacteriocin biosynthesis cyclodehydratase domain-containing protein